MLNALHALLHLLTMATLRWALWSHQTDEEPKAQAFSKWPGQNINHGPPASTAEYREYVTDCS
jgi:hypothetical protein